jgi:hypothetical protein
MYMEPEDLHVLYHQIHQNVARRLGVVDFEWKSTKELADEIQRLNSQVASKVNEFIEAYENWFNVNEQIVATRSAANLPDDLKNRLMNAINNRDSIRKALIDKLEKI